MSTLLKYGVSLKELPVFVAEMNRKLQYLADNHGKAFHISCLKDGKANKTLKECYRVGYTLQNPKECHQTFYLIFYNRSLDVIGELEETFTENKYISGSIFDEDITENNNIYTIEVMASN